MKLILQAKHWQIFLLFIIPQLAVESIIGISNQWLLLSFQLLNIALLLMWLWAVAIALNSKSDTSNALFKFCFIYLVLYSPYGTYAGASYNISEIDLELIKKEWLRLLPHITYLINALYCTFFCAQRLKSIELKRPVTLSEYALDILLIILFPIGIWFLQPRVNKLLMGS